VVPAAAVSYFRGEGLAEPSADRGMRKFLCRKRLKQRRGRLDVFCKAGIAIVVEMFPLTVKDLMVAGVRVVDWYADYDNVNKIAC